MATSCSSRAATLVTRFSSIILKSKKLIEESDNSNKGSDAVMRMIKKEKQRDEETAMIAARALRQKKRLDLEKVEEEAASEIHDDHLATMEIAKLCGGSHMAKNRFWVKKLGLVLKANDDYNDDSLENAPCHDDDLEEGEIV